MKARMFFTLYFVMVLIGIVACLGLAVYTRESLEFIACEFNDGPGQIPIFLTVKNTGTTDLWIVEATLNFRPCWHDPRGFIPVRRGETLPIPIWDDWLSEYPYEISLITKRGNVFSLSRTSPEKQSPLEVENVTWNYTSSTVNMVVRNMGTNDRKITEFRIADAPNKRFYAVTDHTDIGNGTYAPSDQTVTIILDWPFSLFSWISDKTYYFRIETETGPYTTFTSRPP